MKFSGLLFALALPAAAAFVQPNRLAATTALNMESGLTVDAEKAVAAGGGAPAYASEISQRHKGIDFWAPISPEVTVQGGALKTWSFPNVPQMERVLVQLETEGNHIMCNLKVCQGPDNTPQQVDITVGKGQLRPFKALIETPGDPSSIFIRNVGPLEYPVKAKVGYETAANSPSLQLYDVKDVQIVQGAGAIKTFSFPPAVREVKCVLKTDGRPLRAKVELIQGPNSVKECLELYTEDGLDRPFCTVISTPGSGNVIRISNTGTIEFPLAASVEAYTIE